MHKVLIIGEHDGKTLNPATAKCVTCAKGIPDGEISILLLGADTAGVATQAAALAQAQALLPPLQKQLEQTHDLIVPNGIVNMSQTDHVGLDQRASLMGQVKDGKFVYLSQ